MFCGKCGLKLNDNETVCPGCGWKTPNRRNVTDENKTVIADAVKPAPPAAQRANFDYDEPSRQSFGENDYFPPVPAPYVNRTPPTLKRPLNIKNPFPPPVPPKRKSNKGLVVAIVIAAVLLVAGGGFLAYMLIYHNSDDYKICQAQESILQGNYDEALNIIGGIATPQADSVRAFADLQRARDSFAQEFNEGILQGSDAAALKTAADNLSAAYEKCGDSQNLPQKLQEMLDEYKTRLSDRDAALGGLRQEDLTAAQHCLLQFKKRKEGANFTITDLESVIGVSEPAVSAIGSALMDNEHSKGFFGSSQSLAAKTMSEFFTKTNTQVSQDKFDLENYKKSHNNTDSLRLNDIVRRYDAEAGTGLKLLNSDSDAQENSALLYSALQYAWTAYAFDIQ